MVFHVMMKQTNTIANTEETETDYALKVITIRYSRHLKWAMAEFEVCYIFFGFSIDLHCCQFRCSESWSTRTFCKPLIRGSARITTTYCSRSAMGHVFQSPFNFSQPQFICRHCTMKSKRKKCRNAQSPAISGSQHFVYASFLKPVLIVFQFKSPEDTRSLVVYCCGVLSWKQRDTQRHKAGKHTVKIVYIKAMRFWVGDDARCSVSLNAPFWKLLFSPFVCVKECGSNSDFRKAEHQRTLLQNCSMARV